MPCAARSRWRRRLRAGSLRGGSLAARWRSSTCTPRPTTSSSPPIATWPSGKWPGRSPCRCWSRQSPTDDGHHLLAADSHHTRTRTPHRRVPPRRCCSRPAVVRPASAGGFVTRSTGASTLYAVSPLYLRYISPTSRQERLRCGRARAHHGPLARARRQGGAERGDNQPTGRRPAGAERGWSPRGGAERGVCYRVAAGRAHRACPHGRAERARGAQP
jgi:hypothetical protein